MATKIGPVLAQTDYEESASIETPFDGVNGLIATVSSIPTHTPRKISEQIRIYTSGGTYRLYVYDSAAGAWRYSTLT